MTTATAVRTSTAPDSRPRLRRLLGGPFRFYRRRIYVQLIASHLLVALLMAVLLSVGAFILILTLVLPNAAPALVSASGVTEQTRILSRLITADDVAALQSGSAVVADRVNQLLVRVVAAGQPDEFPLKVPATGQDVAIVTDHSGIVLSSSNPVAVPVGQRLETALSSLMEEAVANYQQSGSHPDPATTELAARSSSGFRAAAYVVPGNGGQVAGAVLLERADIKSTAAIWSSHIALAVAAFAALAVVLFTLPALVLALPVGAWRARRVARRLGTLTAAAEDMAHGDLARRVEPAGEDEIGRLGQRFNVMAASLERADRRRRSFVANVSHDLRTPVAIIQGNVERLLQLQPKDAEPPDELQAVQRETVTLARLIDDLFTLAQLDEAVLPIAPVAVALEPVVREVVDGIRGPAWDQRRVVVRAQVDAGLSPVLADPTRLRQILGNLVHNALRFTPEGGLVLVSAEPDGKMIALSVSDTGIGIAPEDLEHVFQRFYRGSEAGNSQDASGLGLAIVKQLVEAQGGTVSVESVLNEGTVFRVTLPIAGSSSDR